MNVGKSTVKNSIKIGIVLLLVAFVLFRFDTLKSAFSVISGIMAPFVMGGAMALFVSVPLMYVEILLRRFIFKDTDSKGLYRGVALFITILLLGVFFFFAMSSVVPDLISTLNQFIEALPEQAERFLTWLRGINTKDLGIGDGIVADLENLETGFRENIQTYIRSIFLGGVGFVSSTFSMMITLFLAASFALYLLFYKETLAKQIKKALFAFLDDDTAQVVLITGARATSSFSNFIGGLTMASVIYGILNYIGMLIIGFPYKTTLSFLSVVLNFIPYFGPFLIGFIGLVLIGAANIQQGLIFVAMTLALQQFESNVIYPKVVGEQVGLPGIWVMVSVTIGGSVMGLLGMLLAVPAATVIYYTLGDIIEYKSIKKTENPHVEAEPVQLSEIMNKSLINKLAKPKRDKNKENNRED